MNGLAFTAPWVLAAGVAALVPVIAHLARHEDRAGLAFPSLMFLARVPFPARARHRIQDRVLLALRLLALAALVLAFAGIHPLYDGATAPAHARDTVVLLDESYSMGAGERFAEARDAAGAAIAGAAPGEGVALVAFDDRARVLSSLDAGTGAAREALARETPGPRSTDLAGALDAAARLLAGSRAAARRVVLVSDLQASGLGADPALPEGVELDLRPVTAPLPANLSLAGAWLDPGASGTDGARRLRIRVRNGGTRDALSTLRVRVDGLEASHEAVALAAGEGRELTLPVFPARDRASRVAVSLDEDGLAADNRRFLVVAHRRTVNVLLVSAGESAPYLRAALALAADPAVRLREVPPAEVAASVLDGVDVLVLDAPLPAAAGLQAALARRAAAGMGVLAFATAAGGLPAFVPGGAGVLADAPAGGASLVPVALSHPVADALGGAGNSVGPVWRLLRMAAGDGVTVLARFDDGAPALVESAAGGGRSLLLATAPGPGFSALARRPEFVPLVLESVARLVDAQPVPTGYEPGAVVDVKALAGIVAGGEAVAAALAAGEGLVVRDGEGGVRRQPADRPLALDTPGFHEVRAGAAGPLWLAVSVPGGESRLEALDADELRARVRRVAAPAVARGAAAGDAGGPRALPDEGLARALLVAGVALLLAEGLLGAVLARRRTTAQEAA